MPIARPATVLRALLGTALLVTALGSQAMVTRPGVSPLPFALLTVQADVGPAAAAAAARAATGGRVLGVKAQRAGDRTVYRVKVLLPGGRMRTVTVDGRSGEVQG